MDERAVLSEGFDYDFWATSAWLNAVPNMPDPKRPTEILEHMAWAHMRWLTWVRPTVSVPEGPLEERFRFCHDQWLTALRDEDLTKILQYQVLTGDTYRTEVGAICRHLIDHGTYHRGQLRGLAEMQNWNDFPDVGMIGYYRTFGLHG